MDQVFGTSPSVTQEPNVSNINPTQLGLQSLLANQYGSLLPGISQNIQMGQPGIPYPTQFAAPLTGQQNQLIDSIVGSATGGNASGVLGNASTALTQILSGQPLDYSQYFKDVIATPLENTFSEETLPAIKAAFARSAGGTTSTGDNTGYEGAINQATRNLNQNLQSANTSLGTTAITNAQQERAQGVSQASGLASSFLNNLTTALGAASLPQQTEQTQLTGQANWANNALAFLSSLFGGSGSLSSAGTVSQGNTVVKPGSPGYLGDLFAGFGGALGKAA